MSDLITKLLPYVDNIVNNFNAKIEDGKLSVSDIYTGLVEAIGDVTLIANEVPNATEDDLKALATHVAKRIYDELLAPLDLPYVPNWIEGSVDDAVGSFVEPVIHGVVAGLLLLVKKHKISVDAV